MHRVTEKMWIKLLHGAVGMCEILRYWIQYKILIFSQYVQLCGGIEKISYELYLNEHNLLKHYYKYLLSVMIFVLLACFNEAKYLQFQTCISNRCDTRFR